MLSKSSVILTAQQEKCVNFSDENPLIVKGIAGSGKSLVIILRAAALYERHKSENPKIAIFTFANSLVKFTNEIIGGANYRCENLNISTIDSEIIKLYGKVMHRKYYGKDIFSFDYDILKKIIDGMQYTSAGESRFCKEEMFPFLEDEIKWMKEHFFSSFDEYYLSQRTGRGSVRLGFGDRQLIYKIYTKYYEMLKEKSENKIESMYEDLYNNKDLIPEELKYDYVLIDECQDLSLSKLKIAKELAKKSITFAADFTQKIYKSGFTWKEIGVQITKGSSKTLSGTFRNTFEIMNFATDFILHNTELLEYLEPEMPNRHGILPQLYMLKSAEEKQSRMFVEMVKSLITENYDRTFAVIVPDNKKIFQLRRLFSNNDIVSQIIRKEENYNVLSPGVKLVTFHSAKGLEFDCVLIPFLDEGVFPNLSKVTTSEDQNDVMNNARNLLYVGMTRAKRSLYMICGNKPSVLIQDFNGNLVKIKTMWE